MNYTIKDVSIVAGESLCAYWHRNMQKITTNNGTFIDNLPENGGHNWKQEIGKTLECEINKSKGQYWIKLKKSTYSAKSKESNYFNTENLETKEELPKDYEISKNPGLKQTYDYIKQNVPIVFLTGGAGTGKSTFIKFLKNNLKKDTGKNLVVLAPTGVAAINAGGQTIHSFFHWNTDVFEDEEVTIGKYINPIAKHTDLFIIDEVSMVHSWMIDHIDYALRLWCDKDKPFGGKQILLIGDCFQLPPVVNTDDEEKKKYYACWESPFFFAAKAFKGFAKNEIKAYQLEKIYRQKNDQSFINILNRIRECKSGYEKDIEYLNDECLIETRFGTKNVPPETLLLCTKNAKADEYNNKKMFNLKQKGSKSITFKAFIQGDFKLDSVFTPNSLEICIGAKIMVTKNIKSQGLVNGDMGTVLNFGGTGNGSDDFVEIEVKQKKYHLTRETWQKLEWKWNETRKTITQKEVGSFTQIPLTLGWAVTIHKSQGLTLDSVAIDAPDAWDSGQVYVALSRAKTLTGVLLCRKIPVSAVKVDKYVQAKYKELFPENMEGVADFEQDYSSKLSNDGFTIDKTEEITSVKIGGIDFELYPCESIQEHVRKTMSILLEKKLIPENEMNKLLTDYNYCYAVFGINWNGYKYTLLRKDRNENAVRYWATNYNGYYICSQWYQSCKQKFAKWLINLSQDNFSSNR